MSEQETNPVILAIARLAAGVERRERDAQERRAKIKPVDSPKRRGQAA